jgi:S-formylglutathione hydrolase FrmB
MVSDELLVEVQKKGINTSRKMGMMGWSMGGYGALRLAGLLGSAHVAAVSAASPALWTDSGDAPSHAFSDAAEYDKYTVYGQQFTLSGIEVRVDCGTGDAFYRAVQDYVDGFPAGVDVVSHFDPGGHDPGYWRRMLPGELDFLGRALRPTQETV